jgi:hypothetical protein
VLDAYPDAPPATLADPMHSEPAAAPAAAPDRTD